jgi:putative DNA primase/helicase
LLSAQNLTGRQSESPTKGFAGAKRQKSLQDESYLDHARSVAIRMFPVATTLGIAEGIETALSCKQLYNVNTWATMTSGFMKKFRVPAGVKNLIIFADRDVNSATGLAAATECAHANLLAKNDLEKSASTTRITGILTTCS